MVPYIKPLESLLSQINNAVQLRIPDSYDAKI